MEELVVSSEYLTTLSKQMRAWQSDELETAIAAVPADWTAAGISLTAIGGAAAVGGAVVGIAFGRKLNAKWETLMAKDFNAKKFSFTGQEAYNVTQMASAGYTIYLQLSSGDYWGASLTVIGLVPHIIEIRNIRSGFAKTIEAANPVTKILDYTGYGLQGMDFCFGPAGALGNLSAGPGIDSDAGEVFTIGTKHFTQAGEELQKLLPGSQWVGTASAAYAEDVRELQAMMNDMAAADEAMAAVLRTETDQLTLTHHLIGTASTVVSLAVPAAVAMYTIPVTGPEISQAFQIAVSFAATVTAVVTMANQLNLCYHNGKSVGVAAERYRAAKSAADALYRSLSTPASGASTPASGASTVPSGSGAGTVPSGSGGQVVTGAAGSSVATPSTSTAAPGGAVDAGASPPAQSGGQTSSQSAGPVSAPAAGGLVGGMSTAGSGRSGPGGESAVPGARTPRHAAPEQQGEGSADGATGTAEAGEIAGAQAGPGVTGAERAPVETATAAPEETRQGSTL
jgi:hypothetical protein